MTSTFLKLSLAATVIYIFWVLLKSFKKSPRKKPARKQISKKIHKKIKGKENKQQASLPSADQIRKEKTEKMKKDPELIGRVIRHWLRER
ncbi:MAG: flagellar biosynthesis/type III secretory pathway M-ring protein FliF/YscJ [Nitrospinales bacterium]|jgi:flagellar biosynthesis/type III secretory pathway M-ring protein FliF/YscJ